MGIRPTGAYADAFTQPDLVSIAAGYANFDKQESLRKSADVRLEYRWGTSLLSDLDRNMIIFDHIFQIHPVIGFETSTLGVLYGLGGFATDVYAGRHIIFSWSEGAGLFDPGYGRPMGSVIEFRSMGELGWRFENEMRVTVYASHTSNAKITGRNPGSEVAGLYWHIPIDISQAF